MGNFSGLFVSDSNEFVASDALLLPVIIFVKCNWFSGVNFTMLSPTDFIICFFVSFCTILGFEEVTFRKALK